MKKGDKKTSVFITFNFFYYEPDDSCRILLEL